MAITYPLTPPASLKTASAQWTARTVVASTSSAFTGQQQVIAHQGEWWELQIDIPATASRQTADEIEAFIIGLRGQLGTFTYGDKLRTLPRGTISTVANAARAGGTGNVAGTSRLTIVTGQGSFAVGDWFSVANQLHRVVQVVNATNFEIFPKFRTTIPSLTVLTVVNPTGLFRLLDNPVISYPKGKTYGPYTLTAREVVV